MSSGKTSFAPSRRAGESELKKAKSKIASQPLIKHLLDAMPNGIVILNPERQIVHANQKFLELTGSKISEVAGLRPGEAVRCEHAANSPSGCGTAEACKDCGAINAVLSSQKERCSIGRDCSLKLSDGSTLNLKVHATPLPLDQENFTIAVMSNTEDEIKRKSLERVFFHEVLNTAGGIQAGADLLADENYNDADKHITMLLKSDAHRIVSEIRSQKDLSKAEKGEISVNHEDCRSTQLLQSTMDCFSQSPSVKGRGLVMHHGAQSFPIQTDPYLFDQVIGSMVKNAAEAERPGTKVTLGCEKGKGLGSFWVHNPTPMPKKVQFQIFKRSYTTKGIGRGQGTYSMKLLGEKYLGGKVSFSVDEWGTTFRFRCPLGQVSN